MTTGSPLIRRGFLKWSVVAFLALLPFVVHSVWDYLESRRLLVDVQRIRADGQPVSVFELDPIPPVGSDADRCERLLRAAAILAGGDASRVPGRSARLENAVTAAEWSDAMRSEVRAYLTAPYAPQDEADRAAFEGDMFKLDGIARALAAVRCARAAIAIVRFRAARGALPRALDELQPGYLDRPLVDPFTGSALMYKIEGDGFSVTSFGSNRRDRRGQLRPLGVRIRAR